MGHMAITRRIGIGVRNLFWFALAGAVFVAALAAEVCMPTGRAFAAAFLPSGDLAWSATGGSLLDVGGAVSVSDERTIAQSGGIVPALTRVLHGEITTIPVGGPGSLVSQSSVSMDASQAVAVRSNGPTVPVRPTPSSASLFWPGLVGLLGVLLRKQPVMKQDSGASYAPVDTLVPSDLSAVVQVIAPDAWLPGMLREPMQRAGYRLDVVTATADLLSSDRSQLPALLLVDQRTSDWDMVRTDRRWKHVSILMVVPQGAVYFDSDLVIDLERGADGVHQSQDGVRLLLARVGAYLRRAGSPGAQRGTLRVGAVELDADGREVTIGDERVALSAKPFAILEALMRAPAKVFSRNELIALVWGRDFAIGAHTLDVHVHAIRQYLEREPRSGCRLVTIKGVGFKLKADSPAAISGNGATRCSAAFVHAAQGVSVSVSGWRRQGSRFVTKTVRPLSPRAQPIARRGKRTSLFQAAAGRSLHKVAG